MSGYVCGEARHMQGRPPNGWVCLRRDGESTWYCSEACLALALVCGQPEEVAALHPWAAIRELGRLSGTGISWSCGTVERVNRAFAFALARAQAAYEERVARATALYVEARQAAENQAECDAAGMPGCLSRDDRIRELLAQGMTTIEVNETLGFDIHGPDARQVWRLAKAST